MVLGLVAKGLMGAGKVAGRVAGGAAKMAGRRALRGRRKKINTEKFMGRESGGEGGEKKGGALAIRPGSSIVSSPGGDLTTIDKSAPAGASDLFVIKTKVIEIDKILKGTLAAQKKAEDDKRKADEKAEAQKEEKELETTKDKENKFKIPVPKRVLSFWEQIKRFFGTVLMGWLAVRLLDWLPKLMPILKFLGKAVDFIIKIGGFLLNALVTFVHWGYKAVEGTRSLIKNLFGEGAAKGFDKLVGILNKAFNFIMMVGLATAALGGEMAKQKKDEVNRRTKNNKKLKDRFNRREQLRKKKRWLKKKKFLKKITPKQIRKPLQRGKILAKKASKFASKTISKVGSKISGAVGKVGGKLAGGLGKAAGKMGGLLKGAGKFIKIPVIGPLIIAVTQLLSGEPIAKAAFMGIGAALGGALGGMLGTVAATLSVGIGGFLAPLMLIIGEGIGAFIGEFLYDGFMGKGWSAAIKKVKDKIVGFITGAGDIAKGIFNWIFGGGLLGLLKNVGGGLLKFATYLLNPGGLLWDILKGGGAVIKAIGGFLFGGGLWNLIKAIGGGTLKFLKWMIVDALPSAIKAVGNAALVLKDWFMSGASRFINNFPLIKIPDIKPGEFLAEKLSSIPILNKIADFEVKIPWAFRWVVNKIPGIPKEWKEFLNEGFSISKVLNMLPSTQEFLGMFANFIPILKPYVKDGKLTGIPNLLLLTAPGLPFLIPHIKNSFFPPKGGGGGKSGGGERKYKKIDVGESKRKYKDISKDISKRASYDGDEEIVVPVSSDDMGIGSTPQQEEKAKETFVPLNMGGGAKEDTSMADLMYAGG